MSLFDDALCAASAAIDAAMGEQWVYVPYAIAGGDPNGRKAPDPDRAAQAIVGIFIEPYARAHSGAARRQGVKAERPGHASARPQIDMDATQLPYAVREGDRVLRVKTGALYHVAEPKKEAAGPRIQVDLNQISKDAA